VVDVSTRCPHFLQTLTWAPGLSTDPVLNAAFFIVPFLQTGHFSSVWSIPISMVSHPLGASFPLTDQEEVGASVFAVLRHESQRKYVVLGYRFSLYLHRLFEP